MTKAILWIIENWIVLCAGAYLGYRFNRQVGKAFDTAENVLVWLYDKIRG